MSKLISNTEYGKKIEARLILSEIEYKDYFILRSGFDNFLSKQVQLSDFVPAVFKDGKWVVLEEPNCECLTEYDREGCCSTTTKCWHYNNKLSKVIFEGFEYDYKMEYWHNNEISLDEEFIENKTIEDLIPYNLTLKESVAKELGLI